MTGLASKNMHYAYDWMTGPKPGELEYLSGARARKIDVVRDCCLSHRDEVHMPECAYGYRDEL